MAMVTVPLDPAQTTDAVRVISKIHININKLVTFFDTSNLLYFVGPLTLTRYVLIIREIPEIVSFLKSLSIPLPRRGNISMTLYKKVKAQFPLLPREGRGDLPRI